jgi:heptose I phosphotransferase
VVYLKRHFQLPRWRGLLTALFPWLRLSPGWAEHHNLRIASDLGIPTPRVVAAGEFLRPGGHLQSVLAVEELTGMIALHEAIPLASRRLPPAAIAKWKRGLVLEIASLTRLMHERSWFHKDLYLCHFFIADADTVRIPETWTGRVTMIDFHRLGRHPLTSPWWTAKDLGQLLYSSDVDGVTARDRLRFWRVYAKAPTMWSNLIRRISILRANNHRGHNARKPQAPKKAA